MFGFYSAGVGQCNNGMSNDGVGSPHEGFTGNFRAPGLTGSLQVNTNLASGAVQMDIDNFNPADGATGALMHALFQWLPNKLTGTDNTYNCPTQ